MIFTQLLSQLGHDGHKPVGILLAWGLGWQSWPIPAYRARHCRRGLICSSTGANGLSSSPFAAILATIVSRCRDRLAAGNELILGGTAVCEQRTFLPSNLFFLALH